MGRKVDPRGFRLGVKKDWRSQWFASKGSEYIDLLHNDFKIRDYIKKKMKSGGIGEVLIQRSKEMIEITVSVERPGVVIGRGGKNIEEAKREIERISNARIKLNIEEVEKPKLDANLVAQTIGEQIERRISYRRAVKSELSKVMKAGALGCKVRCSGRLHGAEISRSEWFMKGSIPTQTLSFDIDYALYPAQTNMGTVGVKVWIYREQDVSASEKDTEEKRENQAQEGDSSQVKKKNRAKSREKESRVKKKQEKN